MSDLSDAVQAEIARRAGNGSSQSAPVTDQATDLQQAVQAELAARTTNPSPADATAASQTPQWPAPGPMPRALTAPEAAIIAAHPELAPDSDRGQPLSAWPSAVVRPIIKAGMALPLGAMDLGVGVRNLATNLSKGITPTLADFNPFAKSGGTPQEYELPSQMFDKSLDAMTTPPPPGFVGHLPEAVSTAILGSRLPLPSVRTPAPQPMLPRLSASEPQAPAPVPTGVVTPGQAGAQAAPGLTGAQQLAADQGAKLGMRLTPGQASGSRSLQQLEAKLESQPWTSGPFNVVKGGNQTVLNRTAARAIGEDSGTVDSTVLARADERLGNVFAGVRSASRVLQADPQATESALNAIDGQYEGLLPGDMSIRDNKLVAQLTRLTQGGAINGQQLGQLSSKLGRAAFKQMTDGSGDRDLGQALYAVKDHVDGLVQATLSDAEAATYGAARQQYRNLMLLTSRPGIVNPSSGNVSGTALAARLQQADRAGFLLGQNQSPLYQATRFSQAFKPALGDSGTATRHLDWADLASLPVGIPSNIASRFYLSGPGSALVRTAPGAVTALGRGTANAVRRAPLNVPLVTPTFRPSSQDQRSLAPWMVGQ